MTDYNIDADPDNADWLRWRLPADTLEGMREWLKDSSTTPQEFRTYPFYRRNLDEHPWLKEL